jgi:hypothetical protein
MISVAVRESDWSTWASRLKLTVAYTATPNTKKIAPTKEVYRRVKRARRDIDCFQPRRAVK